MEAAGKFSSNGSLMGAIGYSPRHGRPFGIIPTTIEQVVASREIGVSSRIILHFQRSSISRQFSSMLHSPLFPIPLFSLQKRALLFIMERAASSSRLWRTQFMMASYLLFITCSVLCIVFEFCKYKLMMPKQQRCSTRRRRVLISAGLVVLAALHSMNQMTANFAESRVIDANAQRSFLAVQHETIPLNRDRGPINAADVESITHVPDTATILVRLKRNRTSCAEPQLIGRLSGIHLSKVKWSYEELTHHDVIVGHYSVPAPGPYFIEIIVTMCERLDINTDAKNACLVNPSQHRITHDNATIAALYTVNSTDKTNDTTTIGIWYHHLHFLRNHKLQPLHTRYQPQGCRHPKTHMTNRCRVPTNTA